MQRLKVKSWDKFQHYKKRNPPWIKLHFDLLASRDWVMLDDASRVLAVACMLLASRDEANDGSFWADPEYIKRVAYLNSAPDFNPLISCGFLAVCKQTLADASTPQADARPETETETETEAETKQKADKAADAMSGFLYGFQKIFPPKQIGTFFASENERIRLAPLIAEYGADILLADVRTIRDQDNGKRYGLAWFLSRWEQSGPGSLPKKKEEPPKRKTLAERQAETQARIAAAYPDYD